MELLQFKVEPRIHCEISKCVVLWPMARNVPGKNNTQFNWKCLLTIQQKYTVLHCWTIKTLIKSNSLIIISNLF